MLVSLDFNDEGNWLMEAFISFPRFYEHVGEIPARCDRGPSLELQSPALCDAAGYLSLHGGGTWTTSPSSSLLQLIKAAGFVSVCLIPTLPVNFLQRLSSTFPRFSRR